MYRTLLVGMAAALLWTCPAHALSIRISSGTTAFSCVDQGGCDTDSAPGVVHASTTLNGAAISINTTGVGFPALGTLSRQDLDNGSVIVSGGSGGTYEIAVSQAGFLPDPSGVTPFAFQAGGTTRGSVTFAAYGDPGDTEFATVQEIAGLGPFTGGAFSGQTTGSFTVSNHYALTVVAEIHQPGNSVTSFDAEISSPIPEPGTLSLVGIGLGLLGFARWRRKSATA